MTSILIFKYLHFTRREITIKVVTSLWLESNRFFRRRANQMKCHFHAVEHNVTLETGSKRVLCNRDLSLKNRLLEAPRKCWGLCARRRWNLGNIWGCIDSNFDEYRRCLKLHRKKRDRGQLHLRAVKLLLHWSRIQKVTYSQFEIFGISAISLSIAADNKRRWTFDASLLFRSLVIRDVNRFCYAPD